MVARWPRRDDLASNAWLSVKRMKEFGWEVSGILFQAILHAGNKKKHYQHLQHSPYDIINALHGCSNCASFT